jgi:hypothetical protein
VEAFQVLQQRYQSRTPPKTQEENQLASRETTSPSTRERQAWTNYCAQSWQEKTRYQTVKAKENRNLVKG